MKKKRADGRYKRSFSFNGKLYYVYGYSKQELDKKEYEKRLELESNRETRDNPTLDQYQAKWTDSRRDQVKESTLRAQHFNYKVCSDTIIDSTGKRLGDMRLKEITVDDIREVQKKVNQTKRGTQGTNDAIAHLSHIFHTAVDERRIDYNPCTLVKPLKRKEERARDTTHRALTKEETAVFFEAAVGSFYYDVFRMAVNTGMRCGEIGALYESDIRNGMINVERTITKNEVGGYAIGDSAKTAQGRRQIPLNDTIREILEHQREINRLLDGNIVSMNERIFKAPERGLLMATPADREIGRICKRTGIQKFTMHAFRATFATRLIEVGVNPRTVQELLGHADFGLTMNLYGHVVDQTKKEAMQQISIALRCCKSFFDELGQIVGQFGRNPVFKQLVGYSPVIRTYNKAGGSYRVPSALLSSFCFLF